MGVNDGVYEGGFASSQEVCDTGGHARFGSLDRLEAYRAVTQTRYLFGRSCHRGGYQVVPDARGVRCGGHTRFECNLKMIRDDCPRLHKWLRTFYWAACGESNGGAFGRTARFGPINEGLCLLFEADGCAGGFGRGTFTVGLGMGGVCL